MESSKKDKIIILGSGHLALRVNERLRSEKCAVQHIPSEFLRNISQNIGNESKFETIEDFLEKTDFDLAHAVYVLDDDDSANLEFGLIVAGICQNVPIYVSLFNKSLGDYLKKLYPDLHVFNPAAIAAPFFTDILEKNSANESKLAETDIEDIFQPLFNRPKFNIDKILTSLFLVFLIFFIVGTIFFKYIEAMSWVDAIYFTTGTIATVGYGDFSLRNSSASSKLFAAFFILSSVILTWVFFSFFIDWLLRKRHELELGRRKYKLNNHIIICGLGRIGYQLAEENINRGNEVLVIELNNKGKFLELARSKGAKILIGDSSLPKNLMDAGVENAAAIFVMVDDDIKNLEIGLTAMSLRGNGTPIILRVFDEGLAQRVRSQLKFRYAYSTTSIAADYLANILK
jgi:voltage-gated potassium channel Kch